MSEHEIELLRIMTALVVRYQDGWERIEAAVEAIRLAGTERCEEFLENERVH